MKKRKNQKSKTSKLGAISALSSLLIVSFFAIKASEINTVSHAQAAVPPARQLTPVVYVEATQEELERYNRYMQAKAAPVIVVPEKLVKKKEEVAVDQKALNCLAKNLFYEARGTNKWEMIRVANVTMNRVSSGIYPKTVCEVVMQYKQFSWTLKSERVNNPVTTLYKNNKAELAQWELSKLVAKRALLNDLPDLSKGSLFYHTHKVDPEWNKNKPQQLASSWHKFY